MIPLNKVRIYIVHQQIGTRIKPHMLGLLRNSKFGQ